MIETESKHNSGARPPLVKQFFQLPGLDYLSYWHARRRLKQRMKTEIDYEDAITTAYEFSGIGYYDNIGPMQVRTELAKLHEVLEEREINTVVEIGVSDGGSLYTFCRGIEGEETVIGIDLPGGEYGGGFPPAKIKFFNLFMKGDQPILIRGNSHRNSIKKSLSEALNDHSIDFLFIDGDHTYDGVRQDYEMYAPLVRDGGVIAMDDIHTHERDYFDQNSIGVNEFWSEIKTEHNTEELIDDAARPKSIGVIYK